MAEATIGQEGQPSQTSASTAVRPVPCSTQVHVHTVPGQAKHRRGNEFGTQVAVR